MIPDALQADCFLAAPPKDRFRIHTEHTGWLAREVSQNPPGASLIATICEEADSHSRQADLSLWREALARECLLAAALAPHFKRKLAATLPPALLETAPFGNGGPSLREYLATDLQCAVAVFPLADDNGGGNPGLGQIWVFPDAPAFHRSGADARISEWLKRECGNHATGLFSLDKALGDFQGDSWQLAAKLAYRAATANEAKTTVELASNWLASGLVEGTRIRRVHIGNKGEVSSRRLLLLPSSNYPDWPDSLERVRFAEYFETAWNWIEGTGIKDGTPDPWPSEGVAELHQLVGGFPGVNIALPLLYKTGKVFLWVTESKKLSLEPAEIIADTLRESIGLRTEMVRIDHRSMALAEQQLRTRLEPTLHRKEKVAINITSGNRLMSFAAHGLARRFPNLWLLYKEIESNEITRIVYEGDYPSSSPLQLPAAPFHPQTPHAAKALGEKIPCKTSADWCALVKEGIFPESTA